MADAVSFLLTLRVISYFYSMTDSSSIMYSVAALTEMGIMSSIPNSMERTRNNDNTFFFIFVFYLSFINYVPRERTFALSFGKFF